MTLTSCQAALGRAHVFTLASIDRTDSPGGAKGGPAGRPAAHYFTVADGAREDVATADLFVDDSEWFMYSVEDISGEAFLTFLALPRAVREQCVNVEAFIDRGVRKLVAEGARVAVTSVASVEEALLGEKASDLKPSDCRICFVWNTGRCGSTLLHKATSALGAVSLSEPQWLDQLLCMDRALTSPGGSTQAPTDGDAAMRRALVACVAAEIRLARAQTAIAGWSKATFFAFNPKGMGTCNLAPAVVKALPHVKHIYMYRACHKVVESFAGLLLKGGISWRAWFVWKLYGVAAVPGPPMPHLPLGELSGTDVARLTGRWIREVSAWTQLKEARLSEVGPTDPIALAPNLRMDEFTSKDLAVRTRVVRATLVHLGALAADATDAELAPALEVFGTHSQAGSAMSGPKAQIVTPNDVSVIVRAVAIGMEPLASSGVVVQDGGKNVLLPDSLA
jgi:hypothetical protein